MSDYTHKEGAQRTDWECYNPITLTEEEILHIQANIKVFTPQGGIEEPLKLDESNFVSQRQRLFKLELERANTLYNACKEASSSNFDSS